MPPRKSTASNPPPDEGAEPGPAPTTTKAAKDKDGLGVEDLTLPKSMIARLAKGVLPANTQIQKDALLAMHKSATVFVSYIASNSNDLARMSNKKTISPQDVMSALKDAELEGFLPRLEAELKKYNDTQCDKRNSYRHRVKAEKAGKLDPDAAAGEGEDAIDATDASLLAAQLNGVVNGHADAGGEDGERPAKKFKGTDGHVVITPGEPIDEADVEDVEAEGDDDVEDEDEEADDEEPEDDDGNDEEGMDETMEGMDEPDVEGRGGMRDEALDGNESD